MPLKASVPVLQPDIVTVNNVNVRCQGALCYIDAMDIFNIFTATEASSERLVWTKFKMANPGVRRVKWEKNQGGVGRITVRADILSNELRAFKYGKCTDALTIADELDALFPNASMVGHEQLESRLVEDVDTSTTATTVTTNALVPSRQQIHSSVCNEIARLAGSFVEEHTMRDFANRQMANQLELIEYQKQHAKSLLDDQSAKSKRLVDNEVLEDKIKRAKGLGNHDLTRELEKRFLDA